MITLAVVLLEGFLEPAKVEGLEQLGPLQGRFPIPGVTGVRHQVMVVTENVAGGLDVGDIHRRVFAEGFPAEFHRRQPQVDGVPRQLGGPFRRVAEQIAGVRTDAVAIPAAEQLVERLALYLATDVPQRDVHPADGVDRHAPASVAVRVVIHPLPEPLDVERVLPHQNVPQAMPPLG